MATLNAIIHVRLSTVCADFSTTIEIGKKEVLIVMNTLHIDGGQLDGVRTYERRIRIVRAHKPSAVRKNK